MEGKKEFLIEINGVQQSIDAVSALKKMLDELSQSIDALNAKTISVGQGELGQTTDAVPQVQETEYNSRAGALREEKTILEEIEKVEQKIVETQSEQYKELVNAKQQLKEYKQIAESAAAKTKNEEGMFDTSTLMGMKQALKSIKAEMQTLDIGSARFKELTKEANSLNSKLKEIEQSYGQFGRNVGNYTTAFNEIKEISVKIGDTERTFKSVREASRELSQELKAMVINGQENTKEFKELSDAVQDFEKASRRAESAVNDLKTSSKGMDNILDMFQSFTALGSVSQGISAFFGIDDNEIQRSIQKLVSLQNVLQGIEKLRQQMNTQEGIGKLLTKGSERIDTFVAGITGAEQGVKGLTMSSRAATIAVRGLSMALKGLGLGVALGVLTAAVEGFKKIGEEVQNYFKGNAQLADVTVTAKSAIEAENNAFKAQQNLLSTNFLLGYISDTEYAIESMSSLAQEVNDMALIEIPQLAASLDKVRGGYDSFIEVFKKTSDSGWNIKLESDILDFGDTTVQTLEEAKDAWEKYKRAVINDEDAISDSFDHWYTNLLHPISFLESLTTTVDDAKDNFVSAGQVIAADWVRRMQDVGKATNGTMDDIKRLQGSIKPLIDEFNNDGITRSVLMNLDKYFPDERLRLKMERVVEYAQTLSKGLDFMSGSGDTKAAHDGAMYWAQVRIDAMAKGSDKIKEQIKLNAKKEKDALIQEYGMLPKERAKMIDAKYAREEKEQLEALNKTRRDSNKKAAKAEEDAEKELRRVKIEQMKGGYNKEKAQLDEELRERVERINKMEITTKKKEELIYETQALYKKKSLELQRDWSYNIVKNYEDMYNQIEQLSRSTFQTEAETATLKVESRAFRQAQYEENDANPLQHQDILTTNDRIKAYDEYYTQLVNIEQSASTKLSKIEQERLNNEKEFNLEDEKLRHERQVSVQTSVLVVEELQKYESEHNGMTMVAQATDKEFQELEKKLKPQLEQMRGTIVDAYNKGEIDFKSFITLVERETDVHNANMLSLENNYEAKIQESRDKQLQELQKSTNSYYTSMISIVRKNEEKISETIENTPRINSWQIVKIEETKEAYNEAIVEYRSAIGQILKLKNKLKADLKAQKITLSDYLFRENEMDALIKSYGDSINQIQEESKMLIGDFISSINQYVQAVGQAMSQLLSSIADYEDSIYQKRMEELNEWIEFYEEKMSEQEQIAEEHKNKIEEIESDISSSRGDRRDRLIDQLNEEIYAQRRAVAEQRKAEKEKQKLEKQKEKEELEQKKKEHKRAVVQAIISAALATVNALATQPFVPVGIAMGALAASLGAAQVALIASQKYAEGGVIEGKSHAQGGVKVLGGRAEVEGGEFITNKVTTTKNVELLEFINSKKKKIKLDDLMEFYSDERHFKKNISVVRTKFADGGIVPTLRTDIDINDRLVTAMEDYAQRPVQVAVVDIIDRTQQVNEVKVLAGLNVD